MRCSAVRLGVLLQKIFITRVRDPARHQSYKAQPHVQSYVTSQHQDRDVINHTWLFCIIKQMKA